MSDEKNPLKDVQNILGFLIAGFGGILTFIGLRSTEVSAVLRNDSAQASFVAFLLLCAILAAAVSVTISDSFKIPLLRAIAVSILTLSLGTSVIVAIPIEESRWPSLIIGLILLAVALYSWISVPDDWSNRDSANYYPIRTQLAFIVVSIMLLASSVYGAMRLETDSQLSSGVQVGAQIVRSPAGMALSVHVTGSKIGYSGYIGVAVLGLPNGIPIVTKCKKYHPGNHSSQCTEDPCEYLRAECEVIFGQTVSPDSNGSINETLSDAFIPRKFEDIYIQTEVCSEIGVCRPVRQDGSRIDIHLGVFPGRLSS